MFRDIEPKAEYQRKSSIDPSELQEVIDALNPPNRDFPLLRNLEEDTRSRFFLPFSKEGSELLERYERLVEAGDPAFRPFLTSRNFSRNFEDACMGRSGLAGPSMKRTLDAAEHKDVWRFLFGVADTYQLSLADREYEKISETKSNDPNYDVTVREPAKRLFEDQLDEVWNIVSDTSDTSNWRKMMLEHFYAIRISLLHVDTPEAFLANAKTHYQRVRDLVDAADPADLSQLAEYLSQVNRIHHSGLMDVLDSEIANGDFRTFEEYEAIKRKIINTRYNVGSENERFPKDVTNDLHHWVEQFENGTITIDDLRRLPQILCSFAAASESIRQEVPLYSLTNYLRNLKNSSFLLSSSETLLSLLRSNILPTTRLIEFINTEGERGLRHLRHLQDLTENGEFDPENPLQVDLELKKYFKIANSQWKIVNETILDYFDYYEEVEGEGLTQLQKTEAEATAYEAGIIYWKIREAIQAGRAVTAIGVKRYGNNYVRIPLSNELNKLSRVQQVEIRLSSSGGGEFTVPDDEITDEIVNAMNNGNDIFIIDGSEDSFDETHNVPRLPRSHYRSLNWFLAWNEAAGQNSGEYDEHFKKLKKRDGFKKLVEKLKTYIPQKSYAIRMFTPMDQPGLEQIAIGSNLFPYVPYDIHEQTPQAVLINSVIDNSRTDLFTPTLRNRNPGFFDDTERHVRKPLMGFTKNGLKRIGSDTEEGDTNAQKEYEYIELVQEHMAQSMPEMIRLAHPVNRPQVL